MTLTVRLDDTLEAALASECAAIGATKSLVVQESLAAGPEKRSAANLAFSAAGLLGGGELGGVSADKAAVRARALHTVAPMLTKATFFLPVRGRATLDMTDFSVHRIHGRKRFAFGLLR